MTVTFCGHSEIFLDEEKLIKEFLNKEIDHLIKKGARRFLLGAYGRFDKICAETVNALKKEYEKEGILVTSELVIPYLDRKYNTELFDNTIYPALEKTPKRYCILKCNQYMVDKSDIVVAFIRYRIGGASKTLEYSEKKKKQIILIK